MDTLTHGFFGYTLFKSTQQVNKQKKQTFALFFTALISNEIPDIDVLANFTPQGEIMSQMWHRGVTHSLFIAPLWALLIYACCRWFFHVKEKRYYLYALFGVLVHIVSDLFNPWGTGFFEPFSQIRITIGTIPIVDLVFWLIFFTALIWARKKPIQKTRKIFRIAALLMFLHFSIQTAQGLYLEWQAHKEYRQVELAATFVPWHFTVIGKNGPVVELSERNLWSKPKPITRAISQDQVNLEPLWRKNPKARVLKQWAPFVIVINNKKQLGIADPRFYRDGFFRGEFIAK